MTLLAYTTAAPLHAVMPAHVPISTTPATPYDLCRVTSGKAMRYAKDSAARALHALMQGDRDAALSYLGHAQRWEAYAATMAR